MLYKTSASGQDGIIEIPSLLNKGEKVEIRKKRINPDKIYKMKAIKTSNISEWQYSKGTRK